LQRREELTLTHCLQTSLPKSLTPHGVGLCCVEEMESPNKKHERKHTRHEEKDIKMLKTRVLHLEIGPLVRGAMLKY